METTVALLRSMSKFSRQSQSVSTTVRLVNLYPKITHSVKLTLSHNLSFTFWSRKTLYPAITFHLVTSSQPGKFVSESKFLSNPAAFVPHIQKPNRDALWDLIMRPEVEREVLRRLRKKATVYAQDLAADESSNQTGTGKIDVDGVVELYENHIIPLTKEVEVGVLFFGPPFCKANGLADRLTTYSDVSMACPMTRSRS